MLVKELTNSECFAILTKNSLGRLATARNDQPYIVPFHFVFDGHSVLYAFSTLGQKIQWMRLNPLVCVEVEEAIDESEWTSLVIFGRYEELPDKFEFEADRNRAHELISSHPMWWQPAIASGALRRQTATETPIYFRIHIASITGHHAVATEPDR